MGEAKNIKDVDSETWAGLKSLAAKNRLKVGEMLRELVKSYEKRSTGAWDRILNYKSKLTKEEIDQLEAAALDMRKHSGWRI